MDELKTNNTKSPNADTTVTINGKQIWIAYHAPSVNGRKIFGGADALQPDGSIWRLGADYATVLHTDADLDLGGVAVPKATTRSMPISIRASGNLSSIRR